MDYEMMIEWFKSDLDTLADEHDGTASNIHLAALGTEDPDEAAQSEEYADLHRELAEVYRSMQRHALEVLKKYM